MILRTNSAVKSAQKIATILRRRVIPPIRLSAQNQASLPCDDDNYIPKDGDEREQGVHDNLDYKGRFAHIWVGENRH
jgi:hypothetical protein